MFVELILVVFVGSALLAIFLPIVYFLWLILTQDSDKAFEEYMEYKYTQAILNNADESNWKNR
jgi:hypothetical protein